MRMKSTLGILSIFGAMMDMGDTSKPNWVNDEPKETDEERERRLAKAEIENNKANGLKEFKYAFGKTVWAINQKNDDRKAKAKGFIKDEII
jgi:hypothetical protein